MADFSVQLSGGVQVPWIDLQRNIPEQASRLVSDPDHLRSYRRFIPNATATISAVVGGVVAPMDAALGGRLFTAAWLEWSGHEPPLIVQAAGQSSLVTVFLDIFHHGHFVLRIQRKLGGAWLVPFDVETPS